MFVRSSTCWIATFLLSAQCAVYHSISRVEVVPKVAAWSTFPAHIDEWEMRDELAIDPDVLDRLRPDDYLNRVYENSSGDVASIFVGYFKSQRDGRAPHSPQNCLPGAGWTSVSNVLRTVRVTDWPSGHIDVTEYIIERDGRKLVVHYWFQQDNRVFTNEIVAQFYAIPELLVHGRTDIALIRIISPVTTSVDVASEHGVRFATVTFPEIRERLR